MPASAGSRWLVVRLLGLGRSVAHRPNPQVRLPAVSELCQIPSETPDQHGDLWGHSDAYRCCRKSLMESALVRVGVSQCGRQNLFPSVLLQPLGHLSVQVESTVYRRADTRSTADCDVSSRARRHRSRSRLPRAASSASNAGVLRQGTASSAPAYDLAARQLEAGLHGERAGQARERALKYLNEALTAKRMARVLRRMLGMQFGTSFAPADVREVAQVLLGHPDTGDLVRSANGLRSSVPGRGAVPGRAGYSRTTRRLQDLQGIPERHDLRSRRASRSRESI